MAKTISNLHFEFMSFSYKFRDFFFSRKKILKEVGIKPGSNVLDYGCGSGSYITATVESVGKSGKIYALDIHPHAIKEVRNIILKKNLPNIETICSGCKTGLPDNRIDIVLLYDVFHNLSDPDGVMEEISRVLKSNGILSVSDHHMKDNEIMSKITNRGLFKISVQGRKTYSFIKG